MKNILTNDGIQLAFELHRATTPSDTICILAHGITVDMTEGGIFNRLADNIRCNGIDTMQFDFRGHGASGGTTKGVTISGEILDIISVFDYCLALEYKNFYLIGASFGAVSIACLPSFYKNKISKIVLWNPVLDLNDTFLNPTLPWGKASFNDKNFANMKITGSIYIDNTFEISNVFVNEFGLYKPSEKIKEYNIPIAIFHGDKDTYVSYDIAKKCAHELANFIFFTVIGSEHGFGRKEDEVFVIENTIKHFTS